MRPDAIARRYARALFALAEQQGTLDQVRAALATTVDALSQPGVMPAGVLDNAGSTTRM